MIKTELDLRERRSNIDRDYLNMALDEQGLVAEILRSSHFTNDLDNNMMRNTTKTLKVLEKSLEKADKIYILVDPDVDGYASSALMYQYVSIKKPSVEIKLALPDGKVHGIGSRLTEDMKRSDLVIIPDSSVNDTQQLEELLKTTPVVLLDHHVIQEPQRLKPLLKKDNFGIMSTQFQKGFDNLTGAGVVFELIRQDLPVFDKMSKNAITVTALGQVADASDVTDKYVRGIVNSGIDIRGNKLYNNIMGDNSVIRDLSFNLIPKLNAVSRIGSKEDTTKSVLALANMLPHETKLVKKRQVKGKPSKEIEIDEYEIFSRELSSIKRKQDKLVESVLEDIDVINNDSVYFGVFSTNYPISVSGLIANKAQDRYQKPAFVVQEIDDMYKGSLRCNGNFNLLSWVNNNTEAEAIGHEQAAGFFLDTNLFDSFIQASKDTLKQQDSFIDVLTIIEDDELDKTIYQISLNLDLFGGKLRVPKIGFRLKDVNFADMSFRGEKIFNLTHKKILFNSFKAYEIRTSTALNTLSDRFDVDIVGEPVIGFDGKPQIMIDEIAIRVAESVKDDDYYDF